MAETSAAPSTPAAQAAAARLAGMKPPAAPTALKAPAAAEEAKGGKEAKAGAEEDGKKKLSVKKIVPIVLVVLLVGFVAKGKIMKPHYGSTSKVPPGQIVDLGQITTNLSDGHLVQVDVQLQLTAPASMKTIAKDEPEFVSNAVTLFGTQTYSSALAPGGRAALRTRLLHTYQAELGTSEGAQQVSVVYFTSFVVQ